MRKLSWVLIALYLITSTLYAQDDEITPFEIGDTIDITMPPASVLLYEIELTLDAPVILEWNGEEETSFFAVRKSDQEILIGASASDTYRIAPPSDDVYLFELSNNNDAPAEISLIS